MELLPSGTLQTADVLPTRQGSVLKGNAHIIAADAMMSVVLM